MFTEQLFFRFRLLLFTVGCLLNITLAILLIDRTVAHSDICWWLFSLETLGLVYYAIVEFGLDRFAEGRLSMLGIIGSAVAAQGVVSKSLEPGISIILSLLAGCNMGLVFGIGLRIRPDRSPIPVNRNSNNKSGVTNGISAEIIPDESPVISDCVTFPGMESTEETSDTMSVVSEISACCISRELFSLTLGVLGLSLGVIGWVLNFSLWIKECLDKDTCSDLAAQWWSLGQCLMFFVMYILAISLSRTFEVLAAYSILVSIPVSILIRVANTARSDFFYLKNQESAYKTWNSTIIGSSLLASAGVLLVTSLGVLHFSWKSPAPERTRSFRATLSLFGLLGVVIFGVGLHSAQRDVCERYDDLCHWYDGLWLDICLEIVIVMFGLLSVFSQPGESIRAILVAMTVVPSFSYIINITRFLENWNADADPRSSEDLWEVRFSATGLVMLSIFNYLWMLAWGWGRPECSETQRHKLRGHSGMTRNLLKTVRSWTESARRIPEMQSVDEEVEMTQRNGYATLTNH